MDKIISCVRPKKAAPYSGTAFCLIRHLAIVVLSAVVAAGILIVVLAGIPAVVLRVILAVVAAVVLRIVLIVITAAVVVHIVVIVSHDSYLLSDLN